MIGTKPLLSLVRDGVTEVVIRGEVVVVSGDRILYATSDTFGSFPARSLLKPFQFLATGLARSGRGNRLEPRFVPALGSISATADQVAQLRLWHADEPFRSRLSWLQLPPAYPIDEVARGVIRAEGRAPDVWCNSCFSKHMAILEACEREAWDPASYLQEEHPFMRRLLELLGELLGENDFGPVTVTDGCGLRSPVLTTKQMAVLCGRLAGPPDGTPLATLARAMIETPEWIGGPSRYDTRIAQRNPGRVLAKEGADGLLGIGVTPDAKYPDGVGILIKTESGYQPNLAAIAAPVLTWLGLEPAHDGVPGQQLVHHFGPSLQSSVRNSTSGSGVIDA
jgi:L-asparaginase